MNGKKIFFLIILPIFLISCQKPTGNVGFEFSFSVDGSAFIQDTIRYTNAAGNRYEITEAQYFISKVILTKEDGTEYRIQSDDGIHYVDVDIPATMTWRPLEALPAGAYKSISFVFGIADDQNISYRFPNYPENNMSWPGNIGGGYHYMKINGRWINENDSLALFNLHMGRGQQRDAEGNITGFIDNSFTITLPVHNLLVEKDGTSIIRLDMDINNWFQSPNIFDFNKYGGKIMQNQEAQETLIKNGRDVFSVL